MSVPSVLISTSTIRVEMENGDDTLVAARVDQDQTHSIGVYGYFGYLQFDIGMGKGIKKRGGGCKDVGRENCYRRDDSCMPTIRSQYTESIWPVCIWDGEVTGRSS